MFNDDSNKVMRLDVEREKKVHDKLLSVCNEICSNYETLRMEFANMSSLLKKIQGYAAAYSEMRLVKMHLDSCQNEVEFNVLKSILNALENVKKGSKEEFLQNIDFLNILEQVFCKENSTELIVFVWEAKKSLSNIIYQIDRIMNCSNPEKKVAVLKGMIAYY